MILYLHSQYESNANYTGGMAERSNAAVLKTVDCNRSGGSNPSSSAEKQTLTIEIQLVRVFYFF